MLSSFVYRCEEIRMKDYYLNDRTPPPRLSDDLAKLCLMGCSLQFAKANDVAQSSKGSTVSAWLELNPVPSCKHGASCLWLFIHKLASYSRTTCMFQHHPTTQVNRFGRSESTIFTNTRSAAAESAESISAIDDLEDGVTMKCWN